MLRIAYILISLAFLTPALASGRVVSSKTVQASGAASAADESSALQLANQRANDLLAARVGSACGPSLEAQAGSVSRRSLNCGKNGNTYSCNVVLSCNVKCVRPVDE